jgi:hypothetical protein
MTNSNVSLAYTFLGSGDSVNSNLHTRDSDSGRSTEFYNLIPRFKWLNPLLFEQYSHYSELCTVYLPCFHILVISVRIQRLER